jgi:repressor LexA
VLVHAKGKSRGFRLANPLLARVPLLGSVVAGVPEPAVQDAAEYVGVPTNWIGRDVTFALHVHGDSMKDAGILEGDIVVVRKTGEPAASDIVAATVDNETTLKRFRRDRRGRCWLHPENPAYRPIPLTSSDTTIHGVVIGLLRDYRAVALGGMR